MSDRRERLAELRTHWEALRDADTLHLLPTEALAASIKYLASELLDRTTADLGQPLRDAVEALCDTPTIITTESEIFEVVELDQLRAVLAATEGES